MSDSKAKLEDLSPEGKKLAQQSLEKQKAQPPKTTPTLFDKILEMVGNDTLELFGPSGSGKTSFCFKVMEEALVKKKKVYYIDTERNFLKAPKGINYEYTPKIGEIIEKVEKLQKGYDLVIIDSVGMPVLTRFALSNMKIRGEMLLKIIGIAGILKEYSYENGSLVIVTNQPVSEMGKEKDPKNLPPFGDKSIFNFKEVWRTELVDSSQTVTNCNILSFRSRQCGKHKPLFSLKIDDKGIEIT